MQEPVTEVLGTFPAIWLVLQLLGIVLRSRPCLTPDIVVKLELEEEAPPTSDLLFCTCEDTVFYGWLKREISRCCVFLRLPTSFPCTLLTLLRFSSTVELTPNATVFLACFVVV